MDINRLQRVSFEDGGLDTFVAKYLYTFIFKTFGESNATIKELEEVKSGITIDKMYQILSKYHYRIIDEIYWFINPIYKYKFGFQKRQVMQLSNSLSPKFLYDSTLYHVYKGIIDDKTQR